MLVLLGGCAAGYPDSERRLQRLPPTSALLPDGAPGAVVVFDPARCVVCNARLNSWISFSKRHPNRVRFLLTRPPTSRERRELVLSRVAPVGIAAGPSNQLDRVITWIDGGEFVRSIDSSDVLLGMLSRGRR